MRSFVVPVMSIVVVLVSHATGATVENGQWKQSAAIAQLADLGAGDAALIDTIPDVLVDVDAGVATDARHAVSGYPSTRWWDADQYIRAITSPAPKTSPWKYAMLALAYLTGVAVVIASIAAVKRVRRYDTGTVVVTSSNHGEFVETLPLAAIFEATSLSTPPTNEPEPAIIAPAFEEQHLATSPLLNLGLSDVLVNRDRLEDAAVEVRRRAHAAIEFLDEVKVRRISSVLEDEIRDQLTRDTVGQLRA